MAFADRQFLSDPPEVRDQGRFWWVGRIIFALLAFLVIGGTVAWFSRERIAGNLIDDALADSGLEANYEIISIGPQRQIIENFMIGDPERPDLTIERVVADIEYGFSGPTIGKVELFRPRLYGTYRAGELSFGALDPAIFGEADGAGELPVFDLAVVDARGLIESDYGAAAFKLDGIGALADGFAGKLAATAPGFGTPDCNAAQITLYGDIASLSGEPHFSGPLRLRQASCSGLDLAAADIATEMTASGDFAKLDGGLALTASDLKFGENMSPTANGTANLVLDQNTLRLTHEVVLEEIASPYARLQKLTAEGTLRSVLANGETQWSSSLRGGELDLGEASRSELADARRAVAGTMFAALIDKATKAATTTVPGSRLAAEVTVRQGSNGLAVVIPEGRVTSPTGDDIVAVSRLSWAGGGPDSPARLSGNFVTGGAGLPQINARMEQRGAGPLALRLAMADYSAGASRLAIPQLQMRQDASGTLQFSGLMAASGEIPGGGVTGLELPVSGQFTSAGRLAMGQTCTTARFTSLSYYEVALDGRAIELCPADGARAIVTYGDRLNVALAANELNLAGQLAGGSLALASKSAELRYPGTFALGDLTAQIGDGDSAVQLAAASVSGGFDETLAGEFAGASAQLAAVALDLDEMRGAWRYEDDTLFIDDGRLRVTERTSEEIPEARFEPLIARDAVFTLAGNAITAQALLRHPGTDRPITMVTLGHNLESGAGRAELDVPGVSFDSGFGPADLTYLADGVVAYANGTVTGQGRIDWTSETLTSSGKFGTEQLDLAAAFGPVQGLSGEIEFTDLLALTTAPNQTLQIASVNPGIEVLAGNVVYSLTNGELITVEDGRWPFMGGELILRPVTLNYGGTGVQRYVFEIIGLDAEIFVAQMQLTNLSASGRFDGTIPVVFDEEGNGTIEGGLLISREPGGNVAYVGELLYEDLGQMGNYAFQSLRSLDYSQMSIALNGDLAGEIVTSMSFDGVRQGEGASQNFVTRRLAKLPIRFNVNVRSQNFYQLATMVRSFWDPSLLGNPLERGSVPGTPGRFEPANPDNPPEAANEARRPDELPVQAGESEDTP